MADSSVESATIYDVGSGGAYGSGGTGLSAGNQSINDFLYGPADPFSGSNIGVPSIGAGAVPSADGSAFPISGAINPNPTGDWMPALTQTLSSAQKSFQTYVSASPSVAIPRPLVPTTGTGSSMLPTGGFSNTTILIVLAIAAGLWWIMKHHEV